jgi:hypothetical protein
MSTEKIDGPLDPQINQNVLNAVMQVGLVGLTVLGFLLTSLKLPQYGLAANLTSQIFWLYCAYKAWREAKQIGIFIVTIVIIVILIGGVIHYWWDTFLPAATL